MKCFYQNFNYKILNRSDILLIRNLCQQIMLQVVELFKYYFSNADWFQCSHTALFENGLSLPKHVGVVYLIFICIWDILPKNHPVMLIFLFYSIEHNNVFIVYNNYYMFRHFL